MTTFLLLLKGALTTLEVSLLAIAIGLAGGLVLGVFSSLHFPKFSKVIRIYVSIIRGTPVFVQLLLVYFALPSLTGIDLSPFMAGVFTLGMNSTAYLAETLRGGINAVDSGQFEAAAFLGYTKRQAFQFVIVPQAVQKVLPAMTNEMIALIKESSLLMILGVSELTKVSKEIVARELNPMEIYLLAAVLYYVMTQGVAYVSKKFEKVAH